MIPGSVTEIRVRYAETDQMRRAHHMAYVGWFELARTEMMRKNGLSYAAMEEQGVLLPVVRLNIDYRKGVAYGEVLEVHTTIEEVRSRRVTFHFLRSISATTSALVWATQAFCPPGWITMPMGTELSSN